MEADKNTDLSIISKRGIYKEKAIYLATFLGGPLVAGYMFSENFKVFGERNKVLPAWGVSIIWTIVTFIIAYFLPDSGGSKIILPLGNAIIAYFIAHKLQGKEINKFIQNGGKLFSWGRTIIVSLVGVAITVALIFIVYLGLTYIGDNTTVRTYGTLKHEIFYDPDNISESDVDSFGNMLSEVGFFDNFYQKTVFIHKKGITYELSIPVAEEYVANKDTEIELRFLKVDLQGLLPENKIVINVVVDSFDDVVKRLE